MSQVDGTLLLEVDELHAGYGDVRVLHGITLEVHEGEAVALVGANGAGKTTLLRAICSIIHPTAGDVRLRGSSLIGRPVHEMVRQGIAVVPEGKQLWPQLTVRETLRIAGASRGLRGESFARQLALVEELFPILVERRESLAQEFSGGQQQMLAIARALMANPRLLLLDEPSLGLAPLIVEQVFDTLRQVRATGVSILLVEQNLPYTLSIADRLYVVDRGEITRSGDAAEMADLTESDLAGF